MFVPKRHVHKSAIKAIYPFAVVLLSLIVLSADAYEVDTHRAISYLAATSKYCTLADQPDQYYLYAYYGMVEGLQTRDAFGNTLTDWLKFGAEEEDNAMDSVFVRPGRHFYNPLNGSGLTDTAVAGLPPGSVFTSALDWAWNGGQEGGNDWDWTSARDYQYKWLTEGPPIYRSQYGGLTFRALGQVIHLIQDMAQPQHSRNDAHTYGWLGGQGAPYEKFCSKNFGSPGQIDALAHEQPPYLSDGTSKLWSPDTNDGAGSMDAHFRSFWDNDKYTGQNPNNLDTDSLGLAEYSNAYFVTSDTMFTGERASTLFHLPNSNAVIKVALPQVGASDPHRFPFPMLANTTFTNQFTQSSAFAVARKGQSINANTPLKLIDLQSPLIPNLFSLKMPSGSVPAEIGLTDGNYNAHAKMLLPKAVSYSTGLLNYFFRGKLSISYRVDRTNVEFTITNRSGEFMAQGEWRLFTSVNGQRTEIKPSSGNSLFNNFLSSDASFIIRVPMQLQSDMGISIVYRGSVGTEHDIAVATGGAFTGKLGSG